MNGSQNADITELTLSDLPEVQEAEDDEEPEEGGEAEGGGDIGAV